MNIIENLKNIGYSDWFQGRVDKEKIANHDVARVVSIHKDSYKFLKPGNTYCLLVSSVVGR